MSTAVSGTVDGAQLTGRASDEISCPVDSRFTGRQRALRRALDVALTAAWLALVTGFAEGLYWFFRKHLLGSLVFIHPGFSWMSPLAQATLFAIPAGLFALAAALLPRRDVPACSVTILSLIGWFNVLLLVPGLHWWARLLAGCGLAATTGRLYRKHRPRCRRIVRRSFGWLVVLLLLAAGVQALLGLRREAVAAASLPAVEEGSPNVLLIVLDTVRADALSVYGGRRDVAPNLCRLAERGAVFSEAWSTAPWTLPSQAGMFTGRLPHELSADWTTSLDDSHPTLAEELSRRGWLTGGFVGNTRYCSEETGLARGFCHYEAYRLSAADFALCTALGRKLLFSRWPIRFGCLDWPGRKSASEVTEPFLRWVDRRGDRPFFAFLNYWDAHDPYLAPPEFQSRKPRGHDEAVLLRNWWWIDKVNVPDRRVAMLRAAYEDCIRALDSHIGRMLDRLEEKKTLANTILIITADHGEHFGDHDLFLHGNSLYEPLLHVPLIVVWPGEVPAGVRVETPVSLRGLPNTVMELAGQVAEFPGDSWVRHWGLTDAASPAAVTISAEIASQAVSPPCHGRSPVAHGPMRCVRRGNLKVIRGGDGSTEAYDLARDPCEKNNLVGHPSYNRQIDRLRPAVE